ncbi:hypothetical protein [Jeotgalibacillus proteolyticus]|nr:hypothetical protein [Jeotgalibacillus proteolyticus]
MKYWFECRIRGKHRYSFYSDRCIVCGKQRPSSSKAIEKEEQLSK